MVFLLSNDVKLNQLLIPKWIIHLTEGSVVIVHLILELRPSKQDIVEQKSFIIIILG